MKIVKIISIAGLGLLSAQVFAAQATPQAAPATTMQKQAQAAPSIEASALKNQSDKLSYTIGVEMGANFKNQGVNINPDLLVAGMKDAMNGGKLAMTKEQMKATIVGFQKQLIAKREAEFKSVASKNAQEGSVFLAKNKSQPGVKTLKDGLQYKVIKAGTGTSPTDGDVVTVNYVGKFIDGTVFDSSYKRGKPATFPISEVIPGWQQALKQMKQGGVWELYVPSKLAYGEQGMGNLIGPNETLIFKIDLLKVKKQS